MATFTKEYIESLLERDMREDKRSFTEYRKPFTVEYGISSKSAEGSARVKIGNTEVVAGIKLAVGTPYPDTPDEGTMMVGVELLPLSSPDFETGPPSIDSIELARVFDRGIRESKAIDVKKLCIKKNEKVWMVFIDVYPINDAGNLFDAGFLAAMAALKDARFPTYDAKTEQVDYKKRTNTKLPLTKTPIEVTVFKIKNKLFVDPTLNESKSYDARLTVASLENKDICGLQKGGSHALTVEDVDNMVALALEKAAELRIKLK